MSRTLRGQLFRAFVASGGILLALGVASACWVTHQRHLQEQSRYFAGLTEMLAELAYPSLSISDYGETQRILGLMPTRHGVIPAVITREGDLLLADYSMRPLFGKVLSAHQARLTEGGSEPLSFEGYDVFHAPIPDKTTLGPNPGRIGTVIAIQAPESLFSVWRSALLPALLIATGILAVLAWIIHFRIRTNLDHPLEQLVRELESRAQAARNGTPTDAFGDTDSSEPAEIRNLRRAISKLLDGIRMDQRRRQDREQDAALKRLAEEIAHDLRVPLRALEEAFNADSSGLTAEQRMRIGRALTRLYDIDERLAEATGDDESFVSPAVGLSRTLPISEDSIAASGSSETQG